MKSMYKMPRRMRRALRLWLLRCGFGLSLFPLRPVFGRSLSSVRLRLCLRFFLRSCNECNGSTADGCSCSRCDDGGRCAHACGSPRHQRGEHGGDAACEIGRLECGRGTAGPNTTSAEAGGRQKQRHSRHNDNATHHCAGQDFGFVAHSRRSRRRGEGICQKQTDERIHCEQPEQLKQRAPLSGCI